jgi:hypothetical protein
MYSLPKKSDQIRISPYAKTPLYIRAVPGLGTINIGDHCTYRGLTNLPTEEKQAT